jgi:hypothetical protein
MGELCIEHEREDVGDVAGALLGDVAAAAEAWGERPDPHAVTDRTLRWRAAAKGGSWPRPAWRREREDAAPG